MSNYRETTASGTSYVRAHTVVLNNQPNYKGIEFVEEKLTTLGDGDVIRQGVGSIRESLTDENLGTAFAILNPATGEDTGTTSTYSDVYVLIHSLYMALATARDEEAEAARIAAEEAEAARIAAEAATTDLTGE